MIPDDTGLLFPEINYYLVEGKTDILIDRLNLAVKKEPGNTSIYNTLGSVYDQLSQSERKIYNDKKSKKYFDLALYNFEKVLKYDKRNYDRLKDEMNNCFKDALPYFEECKKLKSNDQNVNVALREIRNRLR